MQNIFEDPTDFYYKTNNIFHQKEISNDQTAINNFTEISKTNNKKVITLLNNLNNIIELTEYEELLKNVYNSFLKFKFSSSEEQHKISIEINKIIIQTEQINNLPDKLILLRKYNIHPFYKYNIIESPFENTNPYLLSMMQSGLFFPKEYYINNKYQNEINKLYKYRKDVLTKLKLTYPKLYNYDIEEICNDIKEIENILAPVLISNEKKRDMTARINKHLFKKISESFIHLDFKNTKFLSEYPETLSINDDSIIVIDNNLNNNKTNEQENINYNELNDIEKIEYDNGEYYWNKINKLFGTYNEKKRRIDNYIKWCIIQTYYTYISYDFRLLKFNFIGKELNGQKEEKSEEERAVLYIIANIPELIGKLFCDNYFTKKHKTLIELIVSYLLRSYENALLYECNWIMESKEEAICKLVMLKKNCKIGYPDESVYKKNYDILLNTVMNKGSKTDYTIFEYTQLFNKWENYIVVNKINSKTTDINEWQMCAVQTNAYYHPLKNEIVFPAGILQLPFFIYLDEQQLKTGITINANENEELYNIFNDRIYLDNNLEQITMATNFGSIGAIIGHEISHCFDDQGSKFDANGKQRQWWSDNVKQEYEKITIQLIEQFNKYETELIIDNKKVNIKLNGNLTLGENIADLFGLTIAIKAYKMYHNEHSELKSFNDGLKELFTSFSNTWRSNELPQKTKNKIITDVHSISKYRVIGTLRNIEIFYEIFNLEKPDKFVDIFL